MEAQNETVTIIASATITIIALIGVWLYRRYQDKKGTDQQSKG
ncbi:hypothetical protein [Flagellimonas sp.]